MQIHSNYPLQLLNSFGFAAFAQEFVSVKTNSELFDAISYANSKKLPWQIIGGGSNIVLRSNLPGLTIQMQILGKKLVRETESQFVIDVGAGENWHDFVAWTLENNYLGLENLALIPGTVGAAPIQNIGAYGQEVEAFIDSVEVVDTALMKPTSDQESVSVVLSNVDCQFTYRDSIFKSNPSRFVVTQVRFAIPKKWLANIQYAELSKQFFDNPSPSAKDIFLAVCQIRKNKLPDPNLLGNAGSFFHNPVVSSSQFEVLKGRFPDIIANATITPQGKKYYKLAAGWLIDQCGFKGVRLGQIGVYDRQALVLVNHGGASASDLLELASQIKEKVHTVYGVDLVQEPITMPARSD